MADADKTIVTRAEFTSAATAATNRKLLTVDGLTLDIGNTGRRDLSSFLNLTHIESGRIVMSRDGVRIQLWLIDIILKAGAPASATVMSNDRTNTGMLYPTYVATGRAIAATGNGTSTNGPAADVYVNKNLGIVLHGATVGIAYQAAVSWETAAGWGSTLPGVADGQPI